MSWVSSSRPIRSRTFTTAQFVLSGERQLFAIGALAIGVGVFTYSRRVMLTVGNDLLPLSPIAAWVAVVAHSIVLLLFASQGLETFLSERGSDNSSGACFQLAGGSGGVLGIALLRGGRGIARAWQHRRWVDNNSLYRLRCLLCRVILSPECVRADSFPLNDDGSV